jgi:hypothetical protein
VRLYRVEHNGNFPPRLDDLVPVYLKAVPADPMASGTALGYFDGNPKAPAHANDPIVYSVGDNGTDEGGSERLTSGSPDGTDTGPWVEDIVVHLTPQLRKPDANADTGKPLASPTTASEPDAKSSRRDH